MDLEKRLVRMRNSAQSFAQIKISNAGYMALTVRNMRERRIFQQRRPVVYLDIRLLQRYSMRLLEAVRLVRRLRLPLPKMQMIGRRLFYSGL